MKDELIEALAAMTQRGWKVLTTEMSWVYRRMKLGVPVEVPPMGVPHFNKLPSEQEWVELRDAVTAKRESNRRKQAKVLVMAKRERKRDYMRDYMRVHRAKHKAL